MSQSILPCNFLSGTVVLFFIVENNNDSKQRVAEWLVTHARLKWCSPATYHASDLAIRSSSCMMFQAILSLSNHKGNLPKTKELFVPFHFRYLTIYENGNFFLKTNCNAQVEHFFLFFIFSPFFLCQFLFCWCTY